MNSFSQLNIEKTAFSTDESKTPEFKKYFSRELNRKITSDLNDKIHVFFSTQSNLHLAELINPTYNDLQKLIKGRDSEFSKVYADIVNGYYLRGEGPTNIRSIVEIVIPKKSYITSSGELKIEPKDIYQIYPVSYIYSYHAPEMDHHHPIKNPLYNKMQTSTSVGQIQDRYYYLPLFIPKGKAKNGQMEVDKMLLSTITPKM